MLWAIGQPASAAGLMLAFLLGVGLRAIAVRLAAWGLRLGRPAGSVLPRPASDIDPFGAVAAVLGGTGWGREVSDGGRSARHAAVLLAGPASAVLASQVTLAAYRAAYPDGRAALLLNHPSDVLRGVVAPTAGAQLVLSVAVGLLCFAVLALVPIPPLDGFGLLWLWLAHPEAAAGRSRRWLADNHLGIALLLLGLSLPLGAPLLHLLIDAVATPILRVWA